MNKKFTVLYIAAVGMYVAQIKELPGVISQGKTLEEAKENLLDALSLYLMDLLTESVDDSNEVFPIHSDKLIISAHFEFISDGK